MDRLFDGQYSVVFLSLLNERHLPGHDANLPDLDARGHVFYEAEVGRIEMSTEAVPNLAHQPPATHRVGYLRTLEAINILW